MDAKELGKFISELRKEKNMTQLELAGKLNVTDKAVSRWERGLGFPDINTLQPLADALGISLMELMQSRRNADREPISSERVNELLMNTIMLSRENGRLTKMIGFAVLIMFFAAAAVVISALFTDWEIVNYAAASILSGLAAWSVPVWKMTLSRKNGVITTVFLSFGYAMLAVLFQIINIAHDIHINDLAAVIDTIDGIVIVVCLFLTITMVLNVFILIRSKEITGKSV